MEVLWPERLGADAPWMDIAAAELGAQGVP
jgi:hypothetical protein